MATQKAYFPYQVGDVFRGTSGNYYVIVGLGYETNSYPSDTYVKYDIYSGRDSSLLYRTSTSKKAWMGSIRAGTSYKTTKEKFTLFLLTNGKVNPD